MSTRPSDVHGHHPLRIVADLGNSRLKWGRIDRYGKVSEVVALPLDQPSQWDGQWAKWDPSGNSAASWRIASVNPPLAKRLASFLESRSVGYVTWYHSAADVPVRHSLENSNTAGADRALAVLGARALKPPETPGLVVLCGTAITVERIGNDGVWQGGAIAPGLNLSARAMHLLTAQLPEIEPVPDPPPWGRSTLPALRAGVYWGVVGSVRELLTRQAIGLDGNPWVVFSGGDASTLCESIARENAEVVPDLVLRGLARVGFPQ